MSSRIELTTGPSKECDNYRYCQSMLCTPECEFYKPGNISRVDAFVTAAAEDKSRINRAHNAEV